MAGYAAQTSVPVEKTKEEINTTLRRYGAGKFSSGWDEDAGIVFVNFHCQERLIRFTAPMPKPNERRFTHNGLGKRRTAGRAESEYDQETRAVWRRLLLCIKAKLESVEAKIETFEEAFLAQIIIPTGQTMGQWAKGTLDVAYKTGNMPTDFPALPPHKGD